MTIRRLAAALLAASALVAVNAHAQQTQAFPTKPVRLVVPTGAGGSTDLIARAIGEQLSKKWGQPVVIDNRPGAGGTIGSVIVAKAPADGYTLLLGYLGTQAINGALYHALTYDPGKDSIPAASLATVPYMIIGNNDLPVRTLSELVARAKAMPVTYASAGNGSVNHLVGVMFNNTAKVQMTHVPYKTSSDAMVSTMTGQVDVGMITLGTTIQLIQSGKLRPLAVLTKERSSALPNVPTAAEAGFPELTINCWFGLFAPAGTPANILRQISEDANQALKLPRMLESLETMGANPMPMSLAAFTTLVNEDIVRWGKIGRESGMKLD